MRRLIIVIFVLAACISTLYFSKWLNIYAVAGSVVLYIKVTAAAGDMSRKSLKWKRSPGWWLQSMKC